MGLKKVSRRIDISRYLAQTEIWDNLRWIANEISFDFLVILPILQKVTTKISLVLKTKIFLFFVNKFLALMLNGNFRMRIFTELQRKNYFNIRVIFSHE